VKPLNLSGSALNLDSDVKWFGAQLRKMSDKNLLKCVGILAFLCSPKRDHGEPPKEVWVLELKKARSEWRRRHPKAVSIPFGHFDDNS
jgi:hypothetical protein